MRKVTQHTITGVIHCVSGLRIGGSDELLQIGGTDLTCIKHPVTLQPYIPGSSLKGKMRSELEKKFGYVFRDRNGIIDESKPTNDPDNLVGRIFGAHMEPKAKNGPSRIIVRDGQLIDGGQMELKSENIVDRKYGTALHPRKVERVVAGSRFSLKIGIQVFDIDDGQRYKDQTGGMALVEFVKEGLREVQNTGLGSGVSKGSGEIEIQDLQLDGIPFTL